RLVLRSVSVHGPRPTAATQHRAADAGAGGFSEPIRCGTIDPDQPERVPVPAHAGTRLGRGSGRRGTRRDGATVQLDARPRSPADRRAGAANRPAAADSPWAGWGQEDGEDRWELHRA